MGKSKDDRIFNLVKVEDNVLQNAYKQNTRVSHNEKREKERFGYRVHTCECDTDN